MRKPTTAVEFGTPIMSAFREAYAARDARKRVVQTVAGERVIPGRHSSQRRGDEAALKRDLAQELASLLNTVDLHSTLDLGDLPHVRRSILNYGLKDVGRLTSEEEQVEQIRDDLRLALVNYEPRLNPETMHIERHEDNDDVNQRLRFTVAAEMFCKPADVAIDFVAEVDLGSGKISLSRLSDAA